MKISKTPLRISFFGGGTDYPEFFNRHGGAVLGTTINQYIYINALPVSELGKNRFYLSYREMEEVFYPEEIKHPVFREVLKYKQLSGRWHFSVMSDIPAGTGLGSSSSFTVGLLGLINCLLNKSVNKYDLIQEANFVEKELLKENIGIQDQIHAVYGGFNRYDFSQNDFKITPIQLPSKMQSLINESLVLIFTGMLRKSSNILEEQVDNTLSKKNDAALFSMFEFVDEASKLLSNPSNPSILSEFGQLLDESWKLKKTLSSKVSNPHIDDIYNLAKKAGAYGGKLCGAGAGGFLAFLAPAPAKQKLLETFGPLGHYLEVKIENNGSHIINNL